MKLSERDFHCHAELSLFICLALLPSTQTYSTGMTFLDQNFPRHRRNVLRHQINYNLSLMPDEEDGSLCSEPRASESPSTLRRRPPKEEVLCSVSFLSIYPHQVPHHRQPSYRPTDQPRSMTVIKPKPTEGLYFDFYNRDIYHEKCITLPACLTHHAFTFPSGSSASRCLL